MTAVTDCGDGTLPDPSQQILQQHLTGIERALRDLTLAVAQTNAELVLQRRHLDRLDGKLSRLETILNASRRTD